MSEISKLFATVKDHKIPVIIIGGGLVGLLLLYKGTTGASSGSNTTASSSSSDATTLANNQITAQQNVAAINANATTQTAATNDNAAVAIAQIQGNTTTTVAGYQLANALDQNSKIAAIDAQTLANANVAAGLNYQYNVIQANLAAQVTNNQTNAGIYTTALNDQTSVLNTQTAAQAQVAIAQAQYNSAQNIAATNAGAYVTQSNNAATASIIGTIGSVAAIAIA